MLPAGAPGPEPPRAGSLGGLTRPLLFAACVATAGGLLTSNPILTVVAIWSLVAIILLLWREGALPVLLFAMGLQWLSVTMTLIQADLRGESIDRMAVFSTGRELGTATWMGCLALVVVALGIAASSFRRPRTIDYVRYYELARRLDSGRLFLLFFALLLFAQVVPVLRSVSGGLGQVVVGIGSLRYAVLTLLLYQGLALRRTWRLPALAFVLEVVVGFLGYFSTFKEAFVVLVIAAIAAEVRLTRRMVVYGLSSTLTVCLLASFWMAIRTEYRRTLNAGTGVQTVSVPVSTRLQALNRALSLVGPEELAEGFHNGLRRFAYIEFFAAVREHVPLRRPHSGGEIWYSALAHVTQPRLLFPDKPALVSDSVLTNRYTGYRFAGRDEGTSVSMGYVPEAYIDFGFPWMLLPMFGLGILWGLIDRYFCEFSRSGLLGVAMTVSIFAIVGNFGQGITQLMGATLNRSIMYAVFLFFGYRTMLTVLCAGNPPPLIAEDWPPPDEVGEFDEEEEAVLEAGDMDPLPPSDRPHLPSHGPQTSAARAPGGPPRNVSKELH